MRGYTSSMAQVPLTLDSERPDKKVGGCSDGLRAMKAPDHSCEDEEDEEELLRQAIILSLTGEQVEEDEYEKLLKEAIDLSMKD